MSEAESNSVFWFSLLLAVVIYIVLTCCSGLIADFFNKKELIFIAPILFLNIIVNSLIIVPLAKLTINYKIKEQTMISLAGIVVSSIIAVVTIYWNYGYWALVLMALGKNIINAFGVYIYSRWRPRFQFSISSIMGVWSFSIRLLIGGLLSTFVNNISSLLIGKKYGDQQLGYFYQGQIYTNFLAITAVSFVQKMAYPSLSREKGNQSKQSEILKSYFEVFTVILIPLFIGFASISNEFVTIFLGEQWVKSIGIITALSMVAMLTPLEVLNTVSLNAANRTDLFLKVDIAKHIVTLFAILVSLDYGIYAIAWALVGAKLFSYLYSTYFTGKVFGFGFTIQFKIIFPILVASSVMFFLSLQVVFDSEWFQLLCKVILSVMIYIAMVIILKVNIALKLTKQLLQGVG